MGAGYSDRVPDPELVLINFRYHLVSIVAIFLALGLGLLIGTSVASPATVDLLEKRLGTLRQDLKATRDDATRLRSDRDLQRKLVAQAGPWLADRRLAGTPVVVVTDGDVSWAQDATGLIGAAGGTVAGTLTLNPAAWALQDPAASKAVDDVLAAAGLEGGQDRAGTVLTLTGRQLFAGHALLAPLTDAQLVTLSGVGDLAAWPPPDAVLVALTAPHPSGDQARLTAAFLQSVAQTRPTVALSGTPKDRSAVAVLREAAGLPVRLSTFDSAADDRVRFGFVPALLAAGNGSGGHFGLADGLRFVPEHP